jgi:hypothetical protein
LPLNGVISIDASGFERAHVSTYYTERTNLTTEPTNLTIQQLKMTLLVDTVTNAVLDIHMTTTRKHDTQIAPQVVKQNAASLIESMASEDTARPSIVSRRVVRVGSLSQSSNVYDTPGRASR